MTARPQPLRRILFYGILLTLLLAACRRDQAPTAAPSMTSGPTATGTPTATASATATAVDDEPPAATPTSLLSPEPLAVPSGTPIAPPTKTEPRATTAPTPSTPPFTPLPLTVDAFSVEAEDAENGKRLIFNWETTGADRVRILSGTAQREALSWEVPLDGEFTVVVPSTGYRNPSMTLVAYEDSEPLIGAQVVSRSVTIEWECQFSYFFEPEPAACPLQESVSTWAAEQVFERGRMLWFQEIQFGDLVEDNLLFVLYDDGEWHWYPDTWTSDRPESDLSIVPPEGRVQPVRGFGKVWRERPEVRERVGWGLAPEQGYDANWQVPFREAPPGAAYVRTFSDGVIELSGWQQGTWQFVAP
jgi:hypothetical protein